MTREQSQIPAVAGYPHITVPMGYVAGLPVGLSIIGGKWRDHDVIKAGYAFEQASKARIAPGYAARRMLRRTRSGGNPLPQVRGATRGREVL